MACRGAGETHLIGRKPAPGTTTTKTTTTTTAPNTPSDERGARERDLIRKSARFLDSAKIGAKVGPDGAVSEETVLFEEGQPVYFTLKLRESPPGLQTHVVWFDPKNKELGKELHQMNGAKSVTFAMIKPLAPGVYRVEGYWGGNFAAEKTFEVMKKR